MSWTVSWKMYSFVLVWVRTLVTWFDLNLNWLINHYFYYFTAWLSGYMYMFFLLTERLYELLKPPFKNWVTILIGLRNKDPPRFCPERGTPLYKLYRYVPPPPPYREGSFCAVLIWTENGPTFCAFWSGIGMVLEGTTRVFERIYREEWVSSKKGGRNMRIWKGFEEFFCLRPAK